MRVAVDVTALLHRPTGIGTITRELIGRLRNRPGLDLVLVPISWRGRDRIATALPAGLEVVRRPMAARPLRQLWLRADAPPIEWWTGAIDVFWGPNFVVPPTRRAAALASVQDLTPVRYPELCTPDTLQYPALLRRALRRGAHVHVSSQFVAGEVVELLGADADRVHVVGYGSPSPGAGDATAGRTRAGGDRYVLALGTIEPRKDLPTLVAAFDLLAAEDTDLRLVVAGQDGWGVDAYNAAVAAIGHADRIVRVGWVDDAVKADLLAGATAFAYPSLYEGFGLPPLEAMASDVPVVASDVGALREVLGDAALLVPVGDAPALAAALRTATGDDDARQELRAKGLAQCARWSWERSAEDFGDLLERLTG